MKRKRVTSDDSQSLLSASKPIKKGGVQPCASTVITLPFFTIRMTASPGSQTLFSEGASVLYFLQP